MSRLLQLQAAGAAGGAGLPPGFAGSLQGIPAGLGLPSVSSGGGGLLAGLPPSSASPAALAHMMAGARLPGPLPPTPDLYPDKEKELAKLCALSGPLSSQSEDRNVGVSCRHSIVVITY